VTAPILTRVCGRPAGSAGKAACHREKPIRHCRPEGASSSESEIEIDVVEKLSAVTPGPTAHLMWRQTAATARSCVMGIINGAGYRHIGLVALKEPDS
jgi:hypothetical protein